MSSLAFISNLNSIIVISYAAITIFRLFLQYSISTGILNSKTALHNIFKSNLVRALIVFVMIFFSIKLNNISYFQGVLFFISIAAMDFVRYFHLFTNRIIPSLLGNALSFFLGLNWLIWPSHVHTNSKTVLYIWISLNLICSISTFLFGITAKYKNPGDLFVDNVFKSNFKLILLDSATLQLFQTLLSVCLLFLAPEANAAARIGSQVFLAIPNLIIASTAPFIALHLAKGSISYNSKFNLMIVQLFFFIIPITLIYLPPHILEVISGSSNRFYLAYQAGFIANGMSLFVISSFSYGYIQIVGNKHFLIIKIALLTCTLLVPLISLVFLGVVTFNLLAVLTLGLAIFVSKKYTDFKE